MSKELRGVVHVCISLGFFLVLVFTGNRICTAAHVGPSPRGPLEWYLGAFLARNQFRGGFDGTSVRTQEGYKVETPVLLPGLGLGFVGGLKRQLSPIQETLDRRKKARRFIIEECPRIKSALAVGHGRYLYTMMAYLNIPNVEREQAIEKISAFMTFHKTAPDFADRMTAFYLR